MNKDTQKYNLLLYRASDYGLARLLIDSGADCRYIGEDGYSLLHYAAGKNNSALLKLYIEKGLDVNAKTLRRTGFRDRCKYAGGGNSPDAFTDTRFVFPAQSTPLACAVVLADESVLDVVKLLVSHGAEVNAVDEEGKSILDRAKNSKVKEFLISRGAKNGRTVIGQ